MVINISFNRLYNVYSSDVVGFSAVRASGFSRMGDSRIFFENTVGPVYLL